MSRHNIHVPIFGLTSQRPVRAQDGAVPQRAAAPDAGAQPTATRRWPRPSALLVERGVLKPGDTYAITCGEPMGYPGRHQHAEGLPGRLTR